MLRAILIKKYFVLQYHDSGKLACSKAFRHIVNDDWGAITVSIQAGERSFTPPKTANDHKQ
jgi:hypothetical protein